MRNCKPFIPTASKALNFPSFQIFHKITHFSSFFPMLSLSLSASDPEVIEQYFCTGEITVFFFLFSLEEPFLHIRGTCVRLLNTHKHAHIHKGRYRYYSSLLCILYLQFKPYILPSDATHQQSTSTRTPVDFISLP